MATTVWKGHLTFGLVSFPVKLFTAARSEGISFNQLHKSDNSRIKQVIYCQAEDKPIPRSEIVKGYEYEKDRYVVIEDEDIKKMAPSTAKVMEILEFVKSGEVDPIYFESSFYMAPDEAGQKPYALLYDTLKRTGYVGVAKIAMHNREHIVIFRPGPHGLLMHTMYYANEVRQVEEFRTDTGLVKEQELKLAEMLVTSTAHQRSRETAAVPPRRAAFIAAMVSALGFSGSNGRAFSAATRTSSRRKASDTVSPIFFSAAAASLLVCSSMQARTTDCQSCR